MATPTPRSFEPLALIGYTGATRKESIASRNDFSTAYKSSGYSSYSRKRHLTTGKTVSTSLQGHQSLLGVDSEVAVSELVQVGAGSAEPQLIGRGVASGARGVDPSWEHLVEAEVGQTNIFACRSHTAWTVGINGDRITSPAPGLDGGSSGATGRFRIANGEDLASKEQIRLDSTDEIEVTLPGGGGYGQPHARAPQTVLNDVANGYITLEKARQDYGVAVTYHGSDTALIRPPETYSIDQDETRLLRTQAAR
ncbi:MAG: hypothetical protein GEV04_21495 [Actinophytocola sp.]|nr:hypothetical protein [Actinophytocola sp.]